jgi:hypothetical protein
MDLKNLPPAMVSQLTNMVEDYVTSSHKKYAPQAVPLSETQRAAMQPFFSATVLDSARLCVLRGTRVSNPSMYAMAKMMGINNLPDFAAMTAITFVDVIVSHQQFTDALLFHELVHVVQYAQMDLKEFAVRFVNGFIQGGSYEEVPLEKMAHTLENRFLPERDANVFCRGRSWAVAESKRVVEACCTVPLAFLLPAEFPAILEMNT